MRILIVGAGALGCFFGARLREAGLDICLYERDPNKVEHIASQGIAIGEADGSRRVVSVSIYHEINAAAPVDLVLLLVKSYDTLTAAADIARLPGTPAILSLQNGMGNLEKLSSIFPEERIFCGVTYQAAYEKSPGEILHAGSGRTILTPLESSLMTSCRAFAAELSEGGIDAEVMDRSQLKYFRWHKLLVNAAINPLTAIYRVKNGTLIEDETICAEMAGLAREGVAVAHSQGIDLEFEKVWVNILDTCRKTAANRSSMLSDVEKGRRTEIEAINGSIVALGAKVGIATPTQEKVIRRLLALYPAKN